MPPSPPDRPYHPGPPPDRLHAGAGLELRPLTVADARIDFAALTVTRPLLLRRSGYRWPRHGFSLHDNRVDLARHADEHAAGVAFTYTVLERASGRCVGCVYLRPLAGTLRDLARRAPTAGDRGAFDAADAAAGGDLGHASDLTLWTIPELAGDGRDRCLLRSLRGWLARDFGFGAVWLVANEAEARVARLAVDLGLRRTVAARSGERRWRFWALVDSG